MSPSIRLTLYAAVLVGCFGLAWLLGRALPPL
ncbi:hypothetical protein ABID94_000856 [Streptomyces sp. PvR018]